MNNKKICFITCVNDDRQYEECLLYISNLNIPEGYEIDAVSIKEAESMTAGYNAAMQNTDAKYKVYLHQDTFIINKNFILDMLSIFEHHEEIGLMGVAGAKTIPTNGVWWDSIHKHGKVYESHTGKMELTSFNGIKRRYENVKAIDGLIMITQYDIPWREDIFDGWNFYDISQSMEFNLAGYEVVIPNQYEPWCIHDCGSANTIDECDIYRSRFLNEYSKDMFSLVSVLIPTYNRPQYLQLALESVLNQTYKNIEIIIGDDSTNNETEKLIVENYLNKYDNIKYYHNEKNLGQFDNDIKLYNMANGEFINYLMDDDLFEITKIEKMMNYFIHDDNEEISLVTSHRAIIDSNGSIGQVFGNTDNLFKNDTVIGGIDLGSFMLKINFNCIGEPTTALFRKNKLEESFGVYNSRKYGCNVDQATWFNLLSNGKAVFINEVLSYFRIHDNQQLASDKMKLLGALDYAHEVLTAREKGFLMKNEEFSKALSTSLKYCKSVNDYFSEFDGKYDFAEKVCELGNQCELLKTKLGEILNKKSNSGIESTNNLPLVSILIPAYNQTNYLREALESAINQTYPNIEIIIGDDSTNNEVEEFVRPYINTYGNISYFRNERDEMDYGYKNVNQLLTRSKGEYVNYLNHDDVFHPEKIEKMMKYFLENPNITLVTSVRQPIDENGNKLALNGAFSRLFDEDTIVNGRKISRHMVLNLINCIGEPTTVLFKKVYLEDGKYGYFKGRKFTNINDLSSWISILQYGDLMYMTEVLSCFRIHPSQNSNKGDIFIKGIIEWKNFIDVSYKAKIIINEREHKSILFKWLTTYVPFINKFIDDHKYASKTLKNKLNSCYSSAISDIIQQRDRDNLMCPICNQKIEMFLPYQYKEHSLDFIYKYNIVGSDTENFSCPHCYSHDRERHIIKYFDKLKIWDRHIIGNKVLHIAPENHIQKIVGDLNIKEYVCGDLHPINKSIIEMDITNIQFEDKYFDFIICNHVLEHIPDDLKAMKELFRVLKKGGYAVLQTPYSPEINESFENKNINNDELRKKFYGQSDHVRIYGKDLFERIKMAGFKLEIVKNNDLFTEEEAKKYGFNNKEDLILAFKE
ncbi:glycosyltransferase [Clostridium aciditolerans]|nr:glycosyltransferase [Clostridium aciditolerans]